MSNNVLTHVAVWKNLKGFSVEQPADLWKTNFILLGNSLSSRFFFFLFMFQVFVNQGATEEEEEEQDTHL